VRVLDLFGLAHLERIAGVEAQKARLAKLTVFDLLIYASLYASRFCARDFKAKAPAPVRTLITSSPGMRSTIYSHGSSLTQAARPSG